MDKPFIGMPTCTLATYSDTKFEQDLEKPESIMLPWHRLEGFVFALSEFEYTILNRLI